MDSSIKHNDNIENFLNEPLNSYEKAEMDLLRDALNRTYTERFLFATRLYKIQQIFNSAKISHKPFTLNNK